MNQRRSYFQTTSHPRFCHNCGASHPQLAANEQAKHRFCSGCGTEVLLGNKQRTNITIDERGTRVPDPARMLVEKPFLSVQSCLSYLEAHPGQVAVVGGATVVLGGGLVVVAAPLTALAAAVIAGGVTILEISVVGGVVTAVCAAFSKDVSFGTLLKGVGIVALTGIATIVAGGVIGFIAGLCGLLGSVLMACGGVAITLVTTRQLCLHGQARKERIRIDKNLAKAVESVSVSTRSYIEFFPN